MVVNSMKGFVNTLPHAVIATFTGLVFALLTATAPVAAATPVHDMGNMNHHAAAESASCVSLCTGMPINNEQKLVRAQDEEGDKAPTTAYWSVFIPTVYTQKLPDWYTTRDQVFRPPDIVKLNASFRF